MKILVTGANGFLGRYVLTTLLGRGHDIYALSTAAHAPEDGLTWVQGDLLQTGCSRYLMEKVKPEVLVHLAWYAKHGQFWSARENLAWSDASANLIVAFHKSGGRRLVSAGTCAEYDWSQGYCLEDSTPLLPRTLYGKCKDASRHFTETFCKANGLSYAWGRIFFPYGFGEPPERLMPSVFRALNSREVVRCSHGKQFRDFIHASDVAEALAHLAVGTEESGVFNIASGQPVQIARIVELCVSHFQGHSNIEFGAITAQADDPPMLVGSNEKLKSTGWRPRVALEEGVTNYASFYFNERSHMDSVEQFAVERKQICATLGTSKQAGDLTRTWITYAQEHKYSYQFDWLGRPIIQYPQDIVAMQELIWSIKPDLIIETGIAHGGSLIFSASMLAQLDLCDAIEAGMTLDPKKSSRLVIGLDIDIRAHNKAAIEAHPMASRIKMIQGSSVDPQIVAEVKKIAAGYKRVLVCLDSNHTHEHVLAELEAYAPLVTSGSYCVVFDTVVEDLPAEIFSDRPWGPGNNPKTAVWEYLKTHHEFEMDKDIPQKLLVTVAPDGYLRRIKE